MSKRMVNCVKLKTEAEGLDHPPVPGELGQRVLENVSKEAWNDWLRHQTMLINEYRLTPFDPETRDYLMQEMEKYFFGVGSERPKEFVDPNEGADQAETPETSETPETPETGN